MIVVPTLLRGSCLRNDKEDNEKTRKHFEKRLEIQCILDFLQMLMFLIRLNFVPNLFL